MLGPRRRVCPWCCTGGRRSRSPTTPRACWRSTPPACRTPRSTSRGCAGHRGDAGRVHRHPGRHRIPGRWWSAPLLSSGDGSRATTPSCSPAATTRPAGRSPSTSRSPEGLVTTTVAVTNTCPDTCARAGALRAAGGRPRHRAARPDRSVDAGARAAAPALAGGHPSARGQARPHRARREPAARRRGAGVRVRARRGVGHPRGVERRPRGDAERTPRASACSAAASCWPPARWRWRRGSPTARRCSSAPTPPTGSTASARGCTPTCAAPCPCRPAAGAREHLGGHLLRPRPGRSHRARRRRGRGRPGAVRARRRLVPRPPSPTEPGSATGASTPTCGRTGCTR